MSLETKAASTPREQFMQIVQEELAKFEHSERAFRKSAKKDRVKELKLPEDLAH